MRTPIHVHMYVHMYVHIYITYIHTCTHIQNTIIISNDYINVKENEMFK